MVSASDPCPLSACPPTQVAEVIHKSKFGGRGSEANEALMQCHTKSCAAAALRAPLQGQERLL